MSEATETCACGATVTYRSTSLSMVALAARRWASEHVCLNPPPAEVIKADPSTCPHAVLDEGAGIAWGYEDCVTCGKRFPMRTEPDGWSEP